MQQPGPSKNFQQPKQHWPTPATPPQSLDEFTRIAVSLLDRVELDPQQLYRLVGVGLSNFCEPLRRPTRPICLPPTELASGRAVLVLALGFPLFDVGDTLWVAPFRQAFHPVAAA